MAADNVTRYFARVWEDEDEQLFNDDGHEYERNLIVLIVISILVFAVTRFVTYSVDVSRDLLHSQLNLG